MITVVDDFFAKGCLRGDRFATRLARHACGKPGWRRYAKTDLTLVETTKRGHPCYMHTERNLVLLGALREDFRLTFFNAALMKDPKGSWKNKAPTHAAPT